MNIDHINSNSLSPCKVRSKYFTSQSGMDDSLSDFQETKKNRAGPKNPLKTVVKAKSKRAPKKIQGQKDIRTVLKAKRKELESYTKEFDNICKQSGIDVDSEQLQLAIALSKSLQQPESTSDNDSSQTLTNQSRTGKIRATLQEYGFKVPEIKNTNKIHKKRRKHYKLLLTTDTERFEVISDKYSQVLFENIDSAKINHNSNINLASVLLYHLATNANYDLLKDNQVFYVGDLIEKSSSTGVLLKDWADIPGRPITPEFSEPINMNFSEIECSQDELDVILSGTIKNTKNIISKKQIEYSSSINTKCKNVEENNEGTTKVNETSEVVAKNEVSNATERVETVEVIEYRSCSPDIFDDDISTIIEDNTLTTYASQELPHKVITDVNNDFMDLTECINGQNIVRTENSTFQYHKQTHNNITRKISNDFMEITDCIATSSQPVLVNENIDLTYNLNNQKATNIFGERKVENGMNIVTPPVHSVDLEHNIDLTQSPTKDKDNGIISMDLTQSSNSSDDLPFVNLNGNRQNSLDNTIILNVNECKGLSMNSTSEDNKANKVLTLTAEICASPEKLKKSNEEIKLCDQSIIVNCIHNEVIIDLTGEIRTDLEKIDSSNGENKFRNESIFEEYVHDHSDGSKENVVEVNHVNSNMKSSLYYNKPCKNSDIDLSQNSNSTDDNITISPTKDDSKSVTSTKSIDEMLDDLNQVESIQKSCNKSRLGKRNEISIDYDEISDNIHNMQKTVNSINSVVYEITDDYNRETEEYYSTGGPSNSSQHSDAFVNLDIELDYSFHKSKLEVPSDNFMFGGISILDKFSNVSNRSKSTNDIENDLDTPMSDNFLHDVEIKNHNGVIQTNPYSAENLTPHKNNDVAKFINTPKNCEYIVKTDEVTPMADYASMSTPERNRELDKYGLKPFKRKRAIQLLTHIYNQTHPIMEPYSNEDLPSPSKKRKQDSHTDEKRLKSPKKTKRSPYKMPSSKANKHSKQNSETGKENGYEVTNELPVIKNLDCNADEWVFQKREKAKVHTCRLPLHIAFHNYVSCRRELREAILRYEPVNIDVIHKDLVAYGHRYDPKDLLKFMDKKCITVKAIDNDSKNSNR